MAVAKLFLSLLLLGILVDTADGTSKYDCNFETKCPSWLQRTTSVWSRKKDWSNNKTTGPSQDHTTGKGYYAFNYVASSKTTKATFQYGSAPMTFTSATCFTVWYHMTSMNPGTLSILKSENYQSRKVVFKKQGYQGRQWKPARFNIMGKNIVITIQASGEGGVQFGAIAIDDISVTPNIKCLNEGNACTFENNDRCGFTSKGSAQYPKAGAINKWELYQANGVNIPNTDVTMGTSIGHFIASHHYNIPYGTTSLIIPEMYDTSLTCLTFWWRTFKTSSKTTTGVYLTINLLQGGRSSWVATLPFAESDNWNFYETHIRPRSTFKIEFKETIYSEQQRALALDDIKIEKRACQRDRCDFYSSMCAWVNTHSGDQLDWQESVTAGSLPPTAPKKGTDRYIFLVAGQPGDSAQLIGPVPPPYSVDYCLEMSFYFGTDTSGTINVYSVVRGVKTLRWSLSKATKGVWIAGKVPAPKPPHQDALYFIVEGRPLVNAGTFLGIDSLNVGQSSPCPVTPKEAHPSWVTRAPMTTPATTPRRTTRPVPDPYQADCSFDASLCSWVILRGRDIVQFKSKHTGGAYLFIRRDNGYPIRMAEIQSPTINIREPGQCLTFYYRLSGSNPGVLKVLVREGGGNDVTVITKNSPTGPDWQRQQFTISNPKAYWITFSMTTGVTGSEIDLEDVTLTSGQCIAPTTKSGDDKPPPDGTLLRQCTFEQKCNYTATSMQRLTWRVYSKTTPSTRYTGPIADHTFGTSAGHYVYTEASVSNVKNLKAKFTSPTYTDKYGACVKFYYHMRVNANAILNVYVKAGASTGLGDKRLTLRGNQGNDWFLEEMTISAVDGAKGYQIIFESIPYNYIGDIALDDISIYSGKCDLGECNFDKTDVKNAHLCGWSNSHGTGGDNYDWMVTSGKMNLEWGTPPKAHSNNYFLFLRTSQFIAAGTVERLRSIDFPAVTSPGKCMTFWYYMNGKTANRLSVKIHYSGSLNEVTIWQLIGNQGYRWNRGKVPIPVNKQNYQIVLEGAHGTFITNDKGGIAVDDITFFMDSCITTPQSAGNIPTSVPTIPTPTRSTGPFNCDFNKSWCGWIVDSSSTKGFLWFRQTGKSTYIGTKRLGDHSSSHGGSYLYMGKDPRPGLAHEARLDSPVVASGDHCLAFYYYIKGAKVPTLRIYTKTGPDYELPSSPTVVINTSPGNKWQKHQIEFLDMRTPFRLVFAAFRNAYTKGNLAIDDISITNGTCPRGFQSLCDFEDARVCTFSSANRLKGWRLGTFTTLRHTFYDKTLNSKFGHYFYLIKEMGVTTPQKVTSKVQPASPTKPMCVRFWYRMADQITKGRLQAFVYSNRRNGSILFDVRGYQGPGWVPASFSVGSPKNTWQMTFLGYPDYHYMAIDDFSVTQEDCTHPVNCNFDYGMCTWQHDNTDQEDWQLNSGSLAPDSGPVTDHTHPASIGQYLYMAGATSTKGDKARIISQVMNTGPDGCLSFYYNMYGAGMGAMRVWQYKLSDQSRKPIWELSGGRRQGWWPGVIRIPSISTDFKLIFEAERGTKNTSNMAIDDITISQDRFCLKSPNTMRIVSKTITTPAPPTTTTVITTPRPKVLDCTFYNSICDWAQGQNIHFRWMTLKAAGGGPKKDHTGTTNSSYLFASGDANSKTQQARIVSPLVNLKPGEKKCFQFYYMLHGIRVGTLNIYLQTNALGAPVWSRKHNKGGFWSKGQVTLTKTSKIVVEANGGGYSPGGISLDDFKLSSGACSSLHTEKDKMASLACDFDLPDICGYKNGAGSKKWILASGRESSSTRPATDHSSGSTTGNYMTVENTVANKGGGGTLLSRNIALPVQTSYACMTFWAYIKGEKNYLTVSKKSRYSSTILWKSNDTALYSRWNRVQVTLMASSSINQLVFTATMGNNIGAVSIDDIQVVPSSCLRSPNCNFGNLCSWSNDDQHNVFDWVVTTGASNKFSVGPSRDASYSAIGGYALLYTGSNNDRKENYLVSTILPTQPSDYCFKFRFYIQSLRKSKPAILNLYLATGTDFPGTPYWSSRGAIIYTYFMSGRLPLQTSTAGLQTSSAYKIIFGATVGAGQYIAVDKITLVTGTCSYYPPNSKISQPTTTTIPTTTGPTHAPVTSSK